MYENHKPLTINVISDLHYYAKQVGISGAEFEKANSKSQCDLKNCEEILEALARQLEKDNDTDIVLVSGDVTSNAEPASHEDVINLFKKMKEHGKRVYVITATHDYRDDNKTNQYTGDGVIRIDTAPRENLWDMYYEFGPNEAISVHRESMSYVVQLADGYRLFALNDDKNNNNSSGFSEDCFKWITEQVEDAKKNGQFIIPMTHHPMIAPSPFYKIIAGGNMMGDCEKRRNQFADMKVPFMLTGHTHMQDISYSYSPNGNIFYDITTAAPVGFPGTYRKLTVDPANDVVHVKAMDITEKPDFDIGDKTVKQHLSNKFFGMITELIDAAATDIPKLARMVTSFSVSPKLIYKIGWLIKPIAKLLRGLKIKTAAKLCKKESGLSPADYKDIGNEKVIDFIISLIVNLYGGDSPYSPDTAYSKITLGICSIIDSIMDAVGIKLSKLIKNATSVSDLVEPLLFNDGIPDADAELKLYINSKAPTDETPPKPKIKKSRKGKGIIATVVIVTVLLLPIILIYLLFGFLINSIKYHKEISGK